MAKTNVKKLTQAATQYAEALNKLLDYCGYNKDAKVIDRAEIVRIRPECDAKVAVVCEIGSLELLGEEIDFDGYDFKLKNYGFVPDPAILVEPYSSYMVGFYAA